jgi:hypothetical protein
MKFIIKILVCFFIILLTYQIFFANYVLTEGLENGTYQEYDTKNQENQMILIQKNSGNIEVLRKRLDDLSGLTQEVQDLSGNVTLLQTQVDGIIQANLEMSKSYQTSSPEITGAMDEEEEI